MARSKSRTIGEVYELIRYIMYTQSVPMPDVEPARCVLPAPLPPETPVLAERAVDDVAAIEIYDDRGAVVYPGYPQRKLWRDSLNDAGLSESAHKRVLADMDKYAVKAKDAFHNKPVALGCIYELQKSEDGTFAIERLSGADKMRAIMSNTYRSFLSFGMEIVEQYFDLCFRIAGKATVSRIKIPHSRSVFDATLEAIEQDIRN